MNTKTQNFGPAFQVRVREDTAGDGSGEKILEIEIVNRFHGNGINDVIWSFCSAEGNWYFSRDLQRALEYIRTIQEDFSPLSDEE